MSEETILRFDCFGGRCGVYVEGDAGQTARRAAGRAQEQLLLWHRAFTRFSAASELSLLNADPRDVVPATPMMARLAAIAREAAEITGGLVDATMAGELARAGYAADLPPALPLELALALAPTRRPGGPSPARRWARMQGDEAAGLVRRAPGVELDSGGLAKGMFADELAAALGSHRSFAIDCAGDLAFGGAGGISREVEVESPFDGTLLHRFSLRAGGIATSGIGRRSWLGADGRPAHHLLDPATRMPAFTGIVQATAIAPSATLAEIHAKAAVLSGPDRAPGWLPWGGVLVFDEGSHRVLAPEQADRGGEALAAAAG